MREGISAFCQVLSIPKGLFLDSRSSRNRRTVSAILIWRRILVASSIFVTVPMAWRISRRNDCHLAVEL